MWRGINLIRLAMLLRQRRFQTVWILDRTLRPAIAAALGGVPQRIGLGLGAQSIFITNPGIDHSHFHDHPIGWLRALMAAMNVPLPSTEPDLKVPSEVLAAIGDRFGDRQRPWIVLGIGASHPDREWPQEYWAALLAEVRRLTPGTVFLIGGGTYASAAQNLIGQSSGAPAINACDLQLIEATALLHYADLFIGTDSGPMNLAVAVATPAFAMFGVNPVLSYSKFIHPLAPEGGPAPGGMQRVLPNQVLEQVRPYLARRKTQ